MAARRTEEAAVEPLNMLRHSAAHVLAAAVLRLHPEAKYVVGPWTEEPPGFFNLIDPKCLANSAESRRALLRVGRFNCARLFEFRGAPAFVQQALDVGSLLQPSGGCPTALDEFVCGASGACRQANDALG